MGLKKTASASTSSKSITKEKKNKAEASFEFSRFQDEIKVQAYYNYLHRINDNTPGNDLSDWLDAEKIVKSKNGKR